MKADEARMEMSRGHHCDTAAMVPTLAAASQVVMQESQPRRETESLGATSARQRCGDIPKAGPVVTITGLLQMKGLHNPVKTHNLLAFGLRRNDGFQG